MGKTTANTSTSKIDSAVDVVVDPQVKTMNKGKRDAEEIIEKNVKKPKIVNDVVDQADFTEESSSEESLSDDELMTQIKKKIIMPSITIEDVKSSRKEESDESDITSQESTSDDEELSNPRLGGKFRWFAPRHTPVQIKDYAWTREEEDALFDAFNLVSETNDQTQDDFWDKVWMEFHMLLDKYSGHTVKAIHSKWDYAENWGWTYAS